jgi:hypothetical protein
MAIFGPSESGAYSRADVERKRKLAEALRSDSFQAREPFGALAKALTGARSGFEDTQAAEGEKKGDQIMADLLKSGDWQGAMGSEWATPQNLAMASLLQGREWEVGDRQEQWAREDARAAAAASAAAAAAAQPDWEFFESGGDRYRYNAKDPNSTPSMFFDGPDAPPEPPKLDEIYDPVTGRKRSVQWTTGEGPVGGWDEIGGVAAPSDPLVTVNTGDTDSALDKKLSEAEGTSWAGIKDAGMVAGAMAQDLGVLDQLIEIAPQGPIVGPLAETFKGFSSAGDAFQSIVKRVAPSLRTPGSGATSDIEYQGFLESLPSLKNSPEANSMINAIMKSKAALNKKRSDVVTAYQNGDLTVEAARKAMSDLNSASIITPEMRSSLQGIGASGDAPQGPQVGDVVDGWTYNGGDPALQSSWSK